MSVFLLILKVFGYILAAVIVLFFVMLILLLLVPIRYSVCYQNSDGNSGTVKISFLLHLLEAMIRIENDEIFSEVRILYVIRVPLSFPEEKPKSKIEDEKTEPRSLKDRFLTVKNQIGQAISLIENERVKEAVGYSSRKIFKILCSVFPKKLSGSVRFGFKEPFETARTLSILAATVPIHQNSVEIVPDFEEPVFMADVILKGKVYLIVLLVHALSVILNRDVRYTIVKVKKYFKQTKEESSNG